MRKPPRGEGVCLSLNAPTFADPQLTQPWPVHASHCPSALGVSGEPRARKCRCSAGAWTLSAGTEAIRVRRQGDASLLLPVGRGGVWVESAALISAPVAILGETTRAPIGALIPADVEVLLRFLEQPDRPKWRWRRSRPRSGQLVVRRVDRNAGLFTPWRYLGLACAGPRKRVVLIKPELDELEAACPDWEDVCYLDLEDGQEPWQTLLVVYPLPDGTMSPGWGSIARGQLG